MGTGRKPPRRTRKAPARGATAKPANPTAGAPGTLHAPWRLAYLESLGEREAAGTPAVAAHAAGSFLDRCWLAPEQDERNHVIVRTGAGLVMLNAFPYATGHLLVALGEARPTLLDYTREQRAMLWALVDLGAALVEATFEPQGLNIGLNQGRAAGAGVPGHLHVHLVPRWGGDVNFITVVGGVRVIPASLEATAERYRKAWERVRARWA